ncbi:hypothetical protein AYL99_03954 [Fonsecaea erecta]|uniref:Uncharacterized protein n=1 Tax=Fonsecaea erecta TaxID=1367422 RepID=A0A178ZQL0_9EURO|nr:hypothetical protein AYL99_03954 [Fonsecaea erecta]OAP61751.1 hypothetical protein AYL99_03954 [Fonsecaea erecta]
MASFPIPRENFSDLNNKIAVITGASSGIGLATLKLFVENGAQVVNGDLQPLKEEIPNVLFVKTDVTKWADLISLFKATVDKFGRVDVVYANAGIGAKADYFNLEVDSNGDPKEPSQANIAINVIGLINTAVLAIRHMKEQKSGGAIILTASATSYLPFGATDYTTSKHGVLGFMRGIVPELQARKVTNVRVNCVAPSFTRTSLFTPEMMEFLGLDFQKPEAVSEAVALLAVDATRHGQSIYVEEGRHREVELEILRVSYEACNTLPGVESRHKNDVQVVEKFLSLGAGSAI